MNEKAVTSHIRLDAAKRSIWLERNNSGCLKDIKRHQLCNRCQNVHDTARPVRFGLGSYIPDKDRLASSDWIGATPVLITADMVGQILPVFTAIETKPSDWKFNKNDKRSLYQKNFIDMVTGMGGYAGFATSVEDFRKIIKHDQG